MDYNLISKYLSGDIDEEQLKILFDWVNENEDNKKNFSQIKNIWTLKQINSSQTELDTNNEYEIFSFKLRQNIAKKEDFSIKSDNISRSKFSINKVFLRVAAIILLFYSIGITIKYLVDNQKVEYNELITKRGEKSQLVLSDGTKIWLNSETKIKYPANIKRGDVQVYLDGEAYFSVTKNHGRKFVVNTSSLGISVLGTSFNVKSYSNEGIIETTLEKGKISITENADADNNGEVVLRQNQRMVFNKSTSKILITDLAEKSDNDNRKQLKSENLPITSKSKLNALISNQADIKLYTSWKEGKLVFKSERFEDLAIKMERWYNVQIKINDEELKNCRYTGIFEKETIEQAIKALSLTLPFYYKIDQNIITIEKNKSSLL